MNKLFVDANFIISLFRKNEKNHSIAKNNISKLLTDYDCYVSNGVVNEVVTVIMMRTKSLNLTKKAYYFIKDNFTILNEYGIEKYNDRVFSVFQKYNEKTFKLSFIDCSIVIISNHYDLDGVISFDKKFKLFKEIHLMDLN